MNIFSCTDKYELRQREGHFIRQFGTLNVKIAGRSKQEYDKKYNETNKDRIKEKMKEYRENNKDKMKEYRENNKEQQKEVHNLFYLNNIDKIKEYNKLYREANKEQIQKQRKEYYLKHKKISETNHIEVAH